MPIIAFAQKANAPSFKRSKVIGYYQQRQLQYAYGFNKWIKRPFVLKCNLMVGKLLLQQVVYHRIFYQAGCVFYIQFLQ
jgi:hypothetical protein